MTQLFELVKNDLILLKKETYTSILLIDNLAE